MFNSRSNAVKDHMLKMHRSPDYQYFLLVIKVVTGTLRLVYVTKKKKADWTFFSPSVGNEGITKTCFYTLFLVSVNYQLT